MIPVWWSVLLTALGGLGWLLVTLEKRVQGFTVGLSAQVAWAAYAVATQQWGFIASASLFAAINGLGLYRIVERWNWARVVLGPGEGKRPLSERDAYLYLLLHPVRAVQMPKWSPFYKPPKPRPTVSLNEIFFKPPQEQP